VQLHPTQNEQERGHWVPTLWGYATQGQHSWGPYNWGRDYTGPNIVGPNFWIPHFSRTRSNRVALLRRYPSVIESLWARAEALFEAYQRKMHAETDHPATEETE